MIYLLLKFSTERRRIIMITKEAGIAIFKVMAKGMWTRLPTILEAIPATKIAGKVLGEIKAIIDEAMLAGKSVEEAGKAVEQYVVNTGDEATMRARICEEIKQNRDSPNPKYINCAIFIVEKSGALNQEEQNLLKAVLLSEQTLEDEKLNEFVTWLAETYFGGEITEMDEQCVLEAEYVSFNFYEYDDIDYNEEDLIFIRDCFNRIIGRTAFGDYIGYGTDETVEY